MSSATGGRRADARDAALSGALLARVDDVLAEAEELLALEISDERSAAATQESLGLAFRAAVEALRRGAPRFARTAELCDLLVDIQAVQQDLVGREAARTQAPVAAVREALSHLRGARSLRELLDRAPGELCRHCGFERAALFRLEGRVVVLDSFSFEDGPAELSERFVEVARDNPPRLDHMLLETEMIRRGTALLVVDAAADPRTYKPLVEACRAHSYVAAPIMPSGRAIGFLHADQAISRDAVDDVDRDVIGAFAEGLGFAVERAILQERMSAQRSRIEEHMTQASALMRAHDEVELTLEPAGEATVPTAPRPAAPLPADSQLASLLTRREAEVVALMADGSTNLAIAERLVISEGTVKSHVKSILRKLRAANRAEAVSRYMKLSGRT